MLFASWAVNLSQSTSSLRSATIHESARAAATTPPANFRIQSGKRRVFAVNFALESGVARKLKMEVQQKPFTQKKPHQLVYLELGSGNGGMLLSISEDGFRFRAVSPVRPNVQMPFAFSLDGVNRLEGSGEIESLEDDGKSGGLRFTEVSVEFRASLTAWLSADSSSHSSGREATPAASTPLDTMEKIRQDLRAGKPAWPRQPQRAAPPSNAVSIPAPVPEKKAAPIIPDRKTSDRVIPDQPVPDQPALDRISANRPATELPVAGRPVTEHPVANRPVADRINPDRNLKPVFSERLPEPEEPPHTVSRLFSYPLPSAPETEKPAALSSAFLKLAHESKAPPRAPVAPAAPVFLPSAARATPVAAVAPAEKNVAEQPRPYVPPLEASFEQAWERAKLTSPAESPHLSRTAAGSIIAIALAVILGALGYNFRQDIGGSFIELGQRISGGNRAAAPVLVQESAPPESQPAAGHKAAQTLRQPGPESQNLPADSESGANPSSASPKANAPTAAPITGTTSTGTMGAKSRDAATGKAESAGSVKVPAVAKPEQNSQPQNSTDVGAKAGTPPTDGGTGREEFDGAQEILRGSNRQRDLPRAVYLLWASVKKGYVPAEVALGDLYRHGDGVVKNCDQARVLLVAASTKGSADARMKLEQMAERGCE